MTDTVRVPREAGHCNDDAAWAEFERQYRGQPRSFGHMTDFELANAVFMADRYSFELISYQTAAKERIRWLSLRLAEATAMLAASPQGEGSSADADTQPVQTFQSRVLPWLIECFGAEIAGNIEERCDRFIEEALEQVQSLDWSKERAHALVEYVYGRPKGEPHQEAGGVMVTFAALCLAAGLDMQTAGDDELARIMRPEIVGKIRAKQAAKPTGSALPIATPPAEPQWIKHDGGPNPVLGKMVEGQYPGETRVFHGPSEGVVWGRGVIYRVTEGVK